MAETNGLSQEILTEKKLISQDLRAYEPLKNLVDATFQAGLQNQLRPAFPLLLYDRLCAGLDAQRIKKTITQEQCDLYLSPWRKVEKDYGTLDDRDYYDRIEFKEFREWFKALHTVVDLMDMGLRTPDRAKQLPDPMPMWVYHECPEDCAILVKARTASEVYE